MKDKKKMKIVEKAKGVNYINQHQYSKLHGKSAQLISHYVKMGHIEVIKKHEKGKIKYYIDREFSLPVGLESGRPVGS